MERNTKIVLALALSTIILVVLLFLAPRTPELSQDQLTKSPLDLKVEQAIEMVQTSGMPMQGIMLLREVLDEEPKHKGAIWQLGLFSTQSEQYDKAIERFSSLIEIVNDKTHKDNIGPLFELSKAYIATNEYELAISTLTKLEDLVVDETLKQDIKTRKLELNNALKNK